MRGTQLREAATQLREVAEPLETLLVTAPDDVRAHAAELDADILDALVELVAEFRSRWRVAVSWGPATGDGRTLEVLDAPCGLWWVDRSPDRVRLGTTTPTDVYAAITGLLPDTDELPPTRGAPWC